MKVCPVCKSRCFDDMDTCYGCMYRFETKSEAQQVREYAISGGVPTDESQANASGNQQTCEHAKSYVSGQVTNNTVTSRWVQLPAAKVELPPKPNVVPTFHEVEDNVNRYIMLEDVEQFLSRRLAEDDTCIISQRAISSNNNCGEADQPNAAEPMLPQHQNSQKQTMPKVQKRTLTLTLEIPQEAMSMLVC